MNRQHRTFAKLEHEQKLIDQQKQFYKSESESMHKLIKELNEQAMAILYTNSQQNQSNESGGMCEYLVIQRKLSEMKQTVLDEPMPGQGEGSSKTDLQKAIEILEKAQKILQVQKEKGQLLIKPIYCSIIDYNIACCNQQLNKLKVCDKLLS